MTGIRSILPIAALTLAATLSGPVFADAIYKWVDDKGITHYGEKAPKDVKSSTVKVGDTTSSDADDEIKKLNDKRAAAANAEKSDSDTGGKKTAPSSSSVAPAADTKTRNTAVCDQHRKNLETLKSGKRVRATGDDGKPHELGPDEVASQIKIAEDALKACEQQQQLQDAINKAPPASSR